MANISAFFKKLFGTRNQRYLKPIWGTVAQINALEPQMKALSDEQLAGKTIEFRERLAKGETLDDILPEAFAVVREAGFRRLGMRHYDVQLIGGIVLHRGRISEMKTGEGKTLVATLSAYLNALPARGVHVVTVNDYLAKRDAEWMGQIYKFLGLSVGVIVHGLDDDERRANYACDITYGTNNEFGFDYLRDNMKFELKEMVHRYYWPDNPDALELKQRYKVFNYAIVDEVDSILIDEARTPLIISGSSDESTDKYVKVNSQIPFLKKDMDYVVDEKSQTVALTDTGVDRVEKRLGVGNLYDPQNLEWLHHVNQALRAHTLFKRDVNYLVEDGKVIIVDEFTGRKMPGRRWSDGLHQAIEAKEGLEVEEENQTLATITFQNLFRMYKKLSGMTGTADTEAEEFQKIYDLEVTVIPTHRDMVRIDNEDLVYKSERAKFQAVCDEIKECNKRGQPVLVGTVSVEKSELVSKILTRDKVPHNVLNAKNHAREADIVAQAGRKGSVTISTNMAGRGTDILLGGNPENLTRSAFPGVPFEELAEPFDKFKAQCKAEHDEVVALGGLHIIGTERHESRRVDNQLRGRAGRQGDPGSSRFYLSLEDDLLRIFGGDRLQNFMDMLKVPENEPIVHRWVTKALEKAQKRVEEMNFGTRKNLIEFDDVLNQQRMSIYDLRRRVMAHERTHEMVLEAISDVAERICSDQCPEEVAPEEWDRETLATALKSTFNTEFNFKGVEPTFDKFADHAIAVAQKNYEERCKGIVDNLTEIRTLRDGTDEGAREKAQRQWDFYERERYMRELDKQWRMHLVEMEHFKEGVYLNSYAQKDPKLIYKREGYNIFSDMMQRIRQNLVEHLFRVEVRDDREIERLRALRAQQQKEQAAMNYVHGDAAQAAARQQPVKPVTLRRDKPKVGRNDPCPCGSGKKYKQCCLPKDEAAGAA